MKDTKFMRIVALLMAIAVAVTMLACSGGSESSGKTPAATKAEGEDVAPDNGGGSGTKYKIVDDVNVIEDDDLRYVMIYNPGIYDETKMYDSSSLKTGYLGSQVDVSASRADGETDTDFIPGSYPQNLLDYPDLSLLEQNRSDLMGVEHSLGEIKPFYAPTANNINYRQAVDFLCVYEGQYCYVWTSTTQIDKALLENVGKEFDSKIYNQTINKFGPARFDASAGGKGKINLMICPFQQGTVGVHYKMDACATGELNPQETARLNPNLDHDILFVNAIYMGGELDRIIYGTLAHEFQHLITATAALNSGKGWCGTWVNEAMSAYIEDSLYPGVKLELGSVDALMRSNLVRKGQSLYNFDTAAGMFSTDIGVYGSVFAFSAYITNLSGADVFTNFHKYWRESYSSTLCDAEALVNSVSPTAKAEIDNLVEYPASISFANENEEWMSKLALDFYLSMFAKEGDLVAYETIDNSALLYDEINGAEIEGGGRIIVAVDGKFEIPSDADSGLIYVGLDKNFEPVADFVYK